MIRINESLLRSITESLESIKDNTFDQKTIKLLLIDLRESSYPNSELREICHFVAHSERDTGLFYKSIISRYERFKHSLDFLSRMDLTKVQKGMSFNELAFQNIDHSFYYSIPKKYFEIVFIYGLDDYDDSFFDEFVKKTKAECKQLIESSYKKENGNYILRNKLDCDFIQLMSFFHTSIQFKPILDEKVCIEQIIQTIERIINPNNEYVDCIRKYSNEIFLCIMCILHDVNFINETNIIGNSFININESSLYLSCTSYIYSKQLTFTLLSSNANISEIFENYQKYKDGTRLSVFSLNRDSNGKLRLV